MTQGFGDHLRLRPTKEGETGEGMPKVVESHPSQSCLLLVAATITTTVAGAVTIEKFLEIVYTCPSKFRKGVSFLVHSLTELELRKPPWKDAAGTYEGGFLWQSSVMLGKPNTFLGYPIHTQDDMAILAGTEGVLAAFDAWSSSTLKLASSGSRFISGSGDIASGQPTRALSCLLNTHSRGIAGNEESGRGATLLSLAWELATT